MKEILIATGNQGKFREIKEALGKGVFKLISLKNYEDRTGQRLGDPVEDGETFKENAYKKAKYFFDKICGGLADKGSSEKLWVLAEDSGIIVDALAGELGIKTRRWGAGEQASDQEWIDYFMKKMEGVSEERRGAKFVCHACMIGTDGSGEKLVEYFEGETKGVITEKLEAPLSMGIPLSSCFKPSGCDKVYSALSSERKNEISHRGKAMNLVEKFLAKNRS